MGLHILKYKTQGKRNPKGLPRVYFCAHEKDFSAFFETVSDELLAKQNCAVWYDDGGGEEVDLETRELDLSQMNLFVMPITARLLSDDNCRAMAEFRYAIEHHIPVLPLMQESGLETLFNEKCGDLQFLDKYKRDETAISYDEKLEKFLSSVLVGDELATKIRSEFYAYIFLSYRKKDRKYAQKLMQLIHEDDRFCDIAIWYDEFLTPGENFNDAIAEALDKSRLVALVVTPSLLEDPNYVMTVEYPMAKKAGKPVLPVEMMKTPHFRMKRKYKGICVPLAPDAIWKKLWYSQLVGRTSDLWHESNPQHNFLIGLAYLSGIDVEKDNNRALALITAAAEAGLPEAAEKLVSMYQSGVGVLRNNDTALMWQRRLVEIRKAAYEKEPNAETAAAYTLEFSNLGSDLWALRRDAEAEEVLKALEEEGTRIAERIDSYRIKQSVAKATRLLAEICDARGDLVGAEAYYRKTLAMRESYYEEYAREKGRYEAQRLLLYDYSHVGHNCFDRGDFETAETYLRKVKDAAEALYREEQNDDTAESLSFACESMGSLYEMRGDIVAAEEQFRRSVTLMESVVSATGIPRHRRNLAYACGRHGRILCYFYRHEEAEIEYRKGTAIMEDLVSETKTIAHRSLCADMLADLGMVLLNLGKYTEAETCSRKALSLYKELQGEASTVQVRMLLAGCYRILYGIMARTKQNEGMEEYIRKAVVILEDAAAELGTPRARGKLAECYETEGYFYRQKGDVAAAKTSCGKSLEIYEALYREMDTALNAKNLASVLIQLGKLYEGDERRAYLLRARELYEKVLASATDVAYYKAEYEEVVQLLEKEQST